jgi:hypothetical protein
MSDINGNDGIPAAITSPKQELGMAELAQHLKIVTRLRTTPGRSTTHELLAPSFLFSLLMNARIGDGWKLSSRQHEVDIYIAMVLNREGHHVQCVKGVGDLPVSAELAYALMCDFSFRKEWDELLIVGRSVQQIDTYTDIVC